MRLSGICVYKHEATALTGIKLDARSSTTMPLNDGLRDMEKLNDGTMDGAVVVELSKDVDMSDGSYYLDICFNGYMATVESLDLGCNEGLVDDQGITRIGVAAYDDAAHTWPAHAAETHDITWLKTGDAYTGKSVVTLENPVTTSRLRVYILDANRTWDNFRMEEMAAYGRMGEKVQGLAAGAEVSLDFALVAGDAGMIQDGDFASEIRSEFIPTETDPAEITYDFKDKAYAFTSGELVSLFAKDAGVRQMQISCRTPEGEWEQIGVVQFPERPYAVGSTNFEMDSFDLNVTATALKFSITDVYDAWGHFRISDFLLYGTEVAEEPPALTGIKLDARSYTEMPLISGEDDMSKLNDGSIDNGAVVANAVQDVDMTDGSFYIDIVTHGMLSNFQCLDLGCAASMVDDQAVTRIGVAAYDDAAHTWPATYTEEYAVNWIKADGEYTGKAIVPLKQPLKTSRLRVYILDANRTWDNFRMEELAAYGEWLGEKPENLAGKAEVTANFDCEGNFPFSNLTDVDFASEALTNFAATTENPAIITMDFGEDYYEIESMDMVGLFATDAGVTRMTIEYLKDGEWSVLREAAFQREGRYGTTNSQIDRIDLDVTTNGIRFKITEYINHFGHIRISEMALYGKSAVPEPTPSATPEPTPSVTPEPTPSVTPEPTPSVTPEPTPSVTPEPTPSITPEPTPSVTPVPTPSISPERLLNAAYLTTAPLDPAFSDLKRLNNQGIYFNEPVVVNAAKDVDMGRTFYFDVVFLGKLANVQAIQFDCYQAFFAQQSIKKIDVDWYDDANGQWQSILSDYTLSWQQADQDEGFARAQAVFQPVETTRLRIYITDANREWDNFRIEEMAVYGELLAEKPQNLADLAEVEVSYEFDPAYHTASDLIDGDYATKLTSKAGIQPSDTEPAYITFYFGETFVQIREVELATAYARYCGILTGEVQYLDYGQWKTLQPFHFERGTIAATEDYEIDTIPAAVTTNGLRLKITAVILDQTYGNFSINEIVLRGSETTAPPQPRPVEIVPEAGFEALTDGKTATIWTAPFEELPTADSPQEIKLGFKRAVLPKVVTLFGTAPLPQKVVIGYESDAGFVPLTAEATLSFFDGKAQVILAESVETEHLVIRVTAADSAAYTLGEITVLAFDKYEACIQAIENFSDSGIYADYLLAQQEVDKVTDTEDRRAFAEQLAQAKDKALKAQEIQVAYQAAQKKATLSGRLFAAAGASVTLEIKGAASSMTVQVVPDANGTFEQVVDVDALREYGNYTVSTVVEGVTVSGSFVLRAPWSGKEVLRFSIDGISGKISGSSIKVTLPKGSTAVNRVPVFQLSEGASLLFNGTVLESGKSALDFTSPVVLTARAEDGSIAEYTVTVVITSGTGGSGGGGGGFRPSGSIAGNGVIGLPNNQTGSVAPQPDQKAFFVDVPAEHWAYAYIQELYQDGIVDGVGEQRFQPEATVKREEFAKMLVLTMGLTPNGSSAFYDAVGSWCEPYLAAAAERGLINGVSDGIFGVGEDISRQDLAVMIYRALPETARSKTTGTAFADDGEIADYAKDAVYALKELGILVGYENRFCPNDSATRAESAKILAGFKGVWEG